MRRVVLRPVPRRLEDLREPIGPRNNMSWRWIIGVRRDGQEMRGARLGREVAVAD